MATEKLNFEDHSYKSRRVVCITIVPSYEETRYEIDPAVEAKADSLISSLGPSCRVCKFQWLVATDEPCGGVCQDLEHEGVPNVFVFSALVGDDWKFWCKPEGLADDLEFDGVAAFLQKL